MQAHTAAALVVLLAAAGEPFDLPPMPRPDEGYLALWEWLRTVNATLSIPDPGFRWMFGGFSIPILLLFETIGIRKDWKLYPFLLPFWLIFGGIALGVVGGLAATAAHLVLFPVGRIWFTVRDRRRAREGEGASPGAAPARVSSAVAPAAPAPRAPRRAQEALRAALLAIRAEARRARPATAAPGQPPEAAQAILRVLSAAIGAAAGAPPVERAPGRPPPLRPPPPSPRPSEATGAPPAKPDLSAFRPDMSRFRRRPPQR